MAVNAITNWTFSISGVGSFGVYDSEYRYAGGLALIGLGGGANNFTIFNLGSGNIALMIGLTDQDGNTIDYYWNSHYGTQNNGNNAGMMIWNDNDNYASTSIGAEQTFTLINLGQGNVALRATGGSYAGQYVSAITGGWYPQQWSLGNGSVLSVSNVASIQLGGDQLPILTITGSGYQLDLSGRNLVGNSLHGSDMRQCNLAGADLSQVTDISGADFTGASLKSANLGGLVLGGAASWSSADFSGSTLASPTDAGGARMSGAIFDGASLAGMNFKAASLAGASFKNAVLDATDFSQADLTGADFSGASLKGTLFSGATLLGTHFDQVDLSSAVFDAVPNFTRSSSNRTTFNSSAVPAGMLAQNWSWLDLTGAKITGLPTTIASLVANGVLLPDGLDLAGIDLTGASFVGARMYEVQLQGANLQGAQLSSALLKGARMDAANLSLASLDSAFLIAEQNSALLAPPGAASAASLDKLEAASLAKAYMFNTVLDGAHCDGVDFSGALFVTASTLGGQSASAIGASMNFAKFESASVVLAVFNGAQLSAASFANATMVGASFQNNGSSAAQLTPSSDVTHTDASVYQADIRGVDFTGANMDGLNMDEATFSTGSDDFSQIYAGYAQQKVGVAFKYGPTVLGNTTTGTLCPDGSNGPCSLSASAGGAVHDDLTA